MDRAITVTAAELVERRYSARLVENDLIHNQLNDDNPIAKGRDRSTSRQRPFSPEIETVSMVS